MNELLHSKFPLHVVAIFCIIALFLGVRWGYGKREREIVRKHRKWVKEQEAKLPRATPRKVS